MNRGSVPRWVLWVILAVVLLVLAGLAAYGAFVVGFWSGYGAGM